MPKPKPPYSAQFREQMVKLVRAGRKPSELSKEFGCHTTSILNWVRLAVATAGRALRPWPHLDNGRARLQCLPLEKSQAFS